MGKTSKTFAALILVTAMAMSCLTVVTFKLANAQLPVPAPPAPQFSLKYVDASYEVPPSYSVNPYTGQNVTQAGYYVDNRTIQITIVNSNFAQSISRLCFLYYNVQIKGHSVQNWTNLFPYVPNSPSGLFPQNSISEFTIVSESAQSLPTNVPLDFRVQSFLVNQTSGFDIVSTSDWSNPQTITIPASSSSPSPTSPTATVPEFSALTILPLVLILLFASILLTLRRKRAGLNG